MSHGTEPMRFLIRYRHCGQKWEQVWSCACNDECPRCGCEIEPFHYEDFPPSRKHGGSQRAFARRVSIATRVRSLGRRIRRLAKRVDAAYECDDAQAEDLDALLAELREQLTHVEADWEECEEGGDLEEPEYHEGVGIEEQLIRAYAQYGRPTFSNQLVDSRDTLIVHLRAVIEEGTQGLLTASDEEVWGAAKDAYDDEARRRLRRSRKWEQGARHPKPCHVPCKATAAAPLR